MYKYDKLNVGLISGILINWKIFWLDILYIDCIFNCYVGI